jgi:hypothetical protein
MKWNIRCKAIKSNENDNIKKGRTYSGVVIGNTRDEAAISIRTPKGRVLYFSDGFEKTFELVGICNAEIIIPSGSPCETYKTCDECPYHSHEFGCTD